MTVTLRIAYFVAFCATIAATCMAAQAGASLVGVA
jgi:hypothetical protein